MRPVEGSDPLRDDIRLLGGMLGDTVREQAGTATFDLVESIRRTSLRFRREQEHEARLELEKLLGVRVHLETHVRVDRDWQRRAASLDRLGL